MKRVLYLTNVEVPYRVRFFSELSKQCDLVVLYERRTSSNRDSTWAKSEKAHYKEEFLDGVAIGNENSFSLKIISIIRHGWDVVIVGCLNSKVQMLAILALRLLKIPYLLNIDGEPFIDDSMKGKVKKYFLKGANAYLAAGELSAVSLKKALGDEIKVFPYYFSSLSNSEIQKNSASGYDRGKSVLVIGQYFEYKGMDVAFQVAKMNSNIKYKFVGMGKRSQLFCQEMGTIPNNVEIVPFLQKTELKEEYKKCGLLLLPTRQECWGLVVNEAASFGMPIVSTWGSGAAIEFLAKDYPQYLAKSGDPDSLYQCVKACFETDITAYSDFLKRKSKDYSIEKSVEVHKKALDLI